MSEQALIKAAKASSLAYNDKDWSEVKEVVTSDFVYEEVATARKVKGVDQVLEVWKGWAAAFPDSRGTFDRALVTGNTVVLEITWRGTHTGTLETPGGDIPATHKKIEIHACQIVEIKGNKARSMRQFFDMMTMFQQLGVSPAMAGAAVR